MVVVLRIDFGKTNFFQVTSNANDQILSDELDWINVTYFAIEFVQSFPHITPEVFKVVYH